MIEIRTRITDRVNRARLELELRRAIGPLLVSAGGVLIALGCALYVVKNVATSTYTPTETLAFSVSDARGVVGGGRQGLRFKGITAGTISDVRLDDGRAVIVAKLEQDFGPVYGDARAMLRPATALEDMYLDILDRGTRGGGPVSEDRPLRTARTDVSVQVEDVLQAFRPDVRAHLGTVLRDLGGGLGDRGDDLRAAFVRVTPFLQQAAELSRALGHRADLTRRLVSDTSALTGTLGRRQEQLKTLVRQGGATLRAVEGGSVDLDATLTELPRTLRSVSTGFAAVRRVLPEIDRALVRLQPAAERLPDGLLATRRLADAALPAMRALRTPVHRMVPLASQLRPVATLLQQSVAKLRPQVPTFDYATRSIAGCSTALQGFFQWTPSVLKFDDARGPAIRGDFAFGLDSATVGKDPNVRASPSCAPGGPVGGSPGPGGNLAP